MSIVDLKPGDKALVDYILGNKKLTKRLLALGCIEGTPVLLKRVAPLGDPLIINFKGFDLAIRKKDAKSILLKEV
ncbi:ferrous iron transport protein A [Haloimpatiens sp. FM7315]|uniref:FeoA family protein n=1 Tax=Haloimpatiens sp. FM7315 TaxID=3298609 RepID=UPI0035A356A4